MLEVFTLALQAGEVVVDGVKTALETAGNALSGASFILKNLPYILAGGVVAFAGVQIYGMKKNGKFYGEDIVKKRIGLSDKSKKKEYR